jgi:hypothetical protein
MGFGSCGKRGTLGHVITAVFGSERLFFLKKQKIIEIK